MNKDEDPDDLIAPLSAVLADFTLTGCGFVLAAALGHAKPRFLGSVIVCGSAFTQLGLGARVWLVVYVHKKKGMKDE